MTGTAEDVVIRPIKGKDFNKLFGIVQRAFKKEIEIKGLDLSRFSRTIMLYRAFRLLFPVLGLLHITFPVVLVAEISNNIAGEVHLVPHGKGIWTIDSLAVDPDSVKQGIGLRLIKESVDFLYRKRVKRVLTSVRADNVPALRIREKLGYEIFDKRVLLLSEVKRAPVSELAERPVLIRDMKPEDRGRIYEIARVVDTRKVQTYRITPEDFVDSFAKQLIDRVTKSHSKKFVIDMQGEIRAYGHVSYTSPLEAARLESLYIMPSDNSAELYQMLVQRILRFLQALGINRVVVELNADHEEAIETLTNLDFNLLAYSYGLVCLDRTTVDKK